MIQGRQSYTIKDFYQSYKLENIDDHMTHFKAFRDILYDFNTILCNKLLSASEELKMPFQLGSVYIVKYLPKTYSNKSLSVNFALTKQLGKTIYYLNEHSNGYKFRLFWSKQGCKSTSLYKYNLSLVRANKRLLASLIKNKQTDYIELI